MNLKACIIDDEAHAIAVLADYITMTDGIELSGRHTDPVKALQELRSLPLPDIIFLDIKMPGLNGLQLAGILGQTVSVVFTTAYRDHAADAFDLSAADYLLKPISYERFLQSLFRIREPMRSKEARRNQAEKEPADGVFFVQSGLKGQLLRVDPAGVLQIESAGKYVHIHFHNHKVTTLSTLDDMLSRFPSANFFRIHRSFAVNLHKIKSVGQGRVILEDGTAVGIGKLYSDAFFEKLKKAPHSP